MDVFRRVLDSQYARHGPAMPAPEMRTRSLGAAERDIVLVKDLEMMFDRMKCLEILDCIISGDVCAGRHIL
jgi:hypothetical protein